MTWSIFHYHSPEIIEIVQMMNDWSMNEYPESCNRICWTGSESFWYLWSTALQDSAMQYLIYLHVESLKKK